MNQDALRIEASKLCDAIRRIPVVYPPDLSFLADIPIQQSFVVRQLLAGPVFATRRVPFLAFFSEIEGRRFFTLLVTSDSVRQRLDDDDISLLTTLYKPPRKVGWWERFTAEFRAHQLQEKRIREMKRRGEIDSRLVGAMSKLYCPVFHDDDILVDFPEDDFLDCRGRNDDSGFQRAMKSSGIKTLCRRIQPFRCGLPRSFCNDLFAAFRR